MSNNKKVIRSGFCYLRQNGEKKSVVMMKYEKNTFNYFAIEFDEHGKPVMYLQMREKCMSEVEDFYGNLEYIGTAKTEDELMKLIEKYVLV